MSDTIKLDKLEPIKGFPELRWAGKKPLSEVMYYPAQIRETFGVPDDEGWMNKLFWGDNVQVMSHLLKNFRGEIDLIYIDPPFDSKADYSKKVVVRDKEIRNDKSNFEEKQYTDIWKNDEYLQYMFERLILLKELLSEKGCLYLHCDFQKSHMLRMLLDEIFGPNRCVNEIIWHYKTFQGQTSKYFARKHDNLFLYRKGTEFTFNEIFDTELEDTIDGIRWKKYIDDEGRIFGKNMPIQDSRFVRYLNKWKKENDREPEGDDVVYRVQGQPVDSVWHMKGLDPKSGEKNGYPTQKPEELIERIITSSSNPGGLVFDCFMGSGTTQAIASKLGRRFIGSDINLGSIETTKKRLLQQNKKINLECYNINNYELFRNPVEAKELIIEVMQISKLRNSPFDGEKDGWMYKIMPINRISTSEDLKSLQDSLPYSKYKERYDKDPSKPVQSIRLVCMGHEPDLAVKLQVAYSEFKLEVEVVDILRDKKGLTFKLDSEARIVIGDGVLKINEFYPRNLLQKLSLAEGIEDWRELVESVMIDWDYNEQYMDAPTTDIPKKNELVQGVYKIPEQVGKKIKIKILDLLSESYEEVFNYDNK